MGEALAKSFKMLQKAFSQCFKFLSMQAASPPPSCAIVVSSCDAYSDLWPYFFHFFFKHWPAVPHPVYLIANELRYDDERVRTIRVGPDAQWGSNTRSALEQIPEETVLFLLDDFLFSDAFPEKVFNDTLRQFQQAGGKCLELRTHEVNGPAVPGTWFRQATPQNLHAGLNSNLWSKQQLLAISQPGQNIWQCESLLRKQLREGEERFFFLDLDAPKHIFFVEGVRGRFWKPEGLAFVRSQGFSPDLRWRPCPPQGQGFLAKLIRSLHKRRMNRRHQQPASSDGLVKPFRMP